MTRKQSGLVPTPFRQAKTERRAQTAKTILHTALEIDRRRFGKVFRRATYLGDPGTKPQNLREHLIVEDEVVAILVERQAFQNFAEKGAVT